MVRISLSHKFYYVAISKTGSTTVRALLRKYSEITSSPLGAHQSEADIWRLIQDQGGNPQEFVGLATVRNPWARLYSFHKYVLRTGASQPTPRFGASLFYQYCVKYLAAEGTFLDRLHAGTVARPRAQVSFLLPEHESPALLMRLERLEQDLNEAWHQLELDPSDLESVPRTNVASHDDYRDQYDHAGIQQVAEWYSEDISRFGYEYG